LVFRKDPLVLSIIKNILTFKKKSSAPVKIALLFSFDSAFKSEIREELNRVLIPIFEYIDKSPSISVNFKISGTTLSTLLWYNYKFVEKLVSMVASEKIELVGSGFSNCVLTALERETLIDQITKHKEYLKLIFDHLPKGFLFPHECFSRELLPIIAENNFKYFIMEDQFFNSSAAKSFVEGLSGKPKISEDAISRLVFVPRKVKCDGFEFFTFSEFSEFSEVFRKALAENNESIFYKFVQKAFKSFERFDRESLVTLKFDLSNISGMSQKPLFELPKVSEIISNFLQFISESKNIETVTYEKWYAENSNYFDENGSQTINSSGLKRYCGRRDPELHEKLSASADFKSKMARLNGFTKKTIDSRKICSSLLRSDREKIAYNPIIELARMISLYYQHSLGSLDILMPHNSIFTEGMNEAETHLSCLNEFRIKNKGVYSVDTWYDGKEKIIIVNDRIFSLVNDDATINNFIELSSGAEYIGGFIAKNLNRANDLYDFKTGEDFCIMQDEQNETRISYKYQPSHSLLVGAQFFSKTKKLEIVKGMSLFNNKFVTKYSIKNDSASTIKINWKIKYSFAPDYLSVIKYGRPVLGFFSGDRVIDPDCEFKPDENGIGVINKLNESYIYINTLRTAPDSIKTLTLHHSYGVILSYDISFQPFEDKSFILDIGF